MPQRATLFPVNCISFVSWCIFSPTLGNAYRPLGPWYVTWKDIANNVLHISNRVLAEGAFASSQHTHEI